MTRVSIIVPVLNDAASLKARRASLTEAQSLGHEVIIVDGGSGDDSRNVARSVTTRVLQCGRGRALQMNAGARHSTGEVLLFLHADVWLEPRLLEALAALGRKRDRFWGRFDVTLEGRHWLYRVIERMMNVRSRLTGIATGDQAIFVSRALFDEVDGFPRIPLMEDVALSKRLRRLIAPVCLKQRVHVSTRRWAEHGILATTVLMWRLRLRYFLGADPAHLARVYYGPETDPGR